MALISFDIFDTAIKRKTYLPIGIFELIEDKIGNDFKNKRIKAENTAKKYKKIYNIDDIYEFLPEFDKNIEINLEIENCVRNEKVFQIYLKHIKNGDEVIFISDMYLQGNILIRILENCGYNKPKVFVSCDNKSHKGDSSLFNVVQNIISKKIYKHYGDNYISDIIGAKNANIIPEHVIRLDVIKNNIPEVSTKLKKYLVENELSDKTLNQKVACYWSPIIYNFTKWVLDERNSKYPDKNIFFNARDGYVPYLIARDIFKAENIYYIHTSRKSLLPSSIDLDKKVDDIENKVVLDRIVLQRANNISGLLKLLNYPEEKKYLLKRHGVENYPKKKFIIKNEKVLYKHFKKQKENTIKYLNNNNIQDGDMLIDIGYYGSLQYAIQKILDIKLNGCYLQCFENNDIDEQYLPRESYFNKNIIKYCLMVESLFSSSEDGVIAYNNNGEPIFYKDNENKKNFSINVVSEILKSCKYINSENDFKITYNDVEKLVTRFQYYPTLEEAHYCTDEIFENGDLYNNESVVWYNRGKIKQGELQDCYNKSYWRPAFEKLLQNDSELSYLEKYLKKEY